MMVTDLYFLSYIRLLQCYTLLKINGYVDNGLDIGVVSTCMLVSFCPLGQLLLVLPFW